MACMKMMGRIAAKRQSCACKKHHTPPVSWVKRARRQQRAQEKAQMQREEMQR